MRASGSHSVTFEGVELPAAALRGGFPAGDRCLHGAQPERGRSSTPPLGRHRRGGPRGGRLARRPRRGARARPMLAAENAIELSAAGRRRSRRAAALIDEHHPAHAGRDGADEELAALFAEAQAAKTFVNEAAARSSTARSPSRAAPATSTATRSRAPTATSAPAPSCTPWAPTAPTSSLGGVALGLGSSSCSSSPPQSDPKGNPCVASCTPPRRHPRLRPDGRQLAGGRRAAGDHGEGDVPRGRPRSRTATHFEVGRALAVRLGYPRRCRRDPGRASASFAGVGYHSGPRALRRANRARPRLGLWHRRLLRRLQVGRRPCRRGRLDRRAGRQGREPARRGAASSTSSSSREGSTTRPSTDASFDVVISNGVINLSPDKDAGFRARRRAFCDPAVGWPSPTSSASEPLTRGTDATSTLWAACIAGAIPRYELCPGHRGGRLRIETGWRNDYRFVSAARAPAGERYGVTSVSVLATKPEDVQRS